MGKRRTVRLHPVRARILSCERGRPVVVGEHVRVEKRRMRSGELVERVARSLVDVKRDQLNPGARDRGVILLRRTGAGRDGPDTVCDQVGGSSDSHAAHGEPGEVHVLAVTERTGRCSRLREERVELAPAWR